MKCPKCKIKMYEPKDIYDWYVCTKCWETYKIINVPTSGIDKWLIMREINRKKRKRNN